MAGKSSDSFTNKREGANTILDCHGELQDCLREWLAFAVCESCRTLTASTSLVVKSATSNGTHDKIALLPRLNIITAEAVQRNLKHTMTIGDKAEQLMTDVMLVILSSLEQIISPRILARPDWK
ncbi:hypothetical protein [Caballeronia novacaledonica]|uniref:Uncharacterized protein n=1 Tax=Caballeronia novacaledonica TaxID=1544861 RepID=A0AA37MSZ7_9BURK|nr:hypothetical protein [Caballeronia novacaledonica]GJH26997.1 hypothetical protein CBA19CS42_20795 [Caballeronia novacaledonica]